MGNCMATKHAIKLSYKEDDIKIVMGSTSANPDPVVARSQSANEVAGAIRQLSDSVDLKTLTSLAAGTSHHRGGSVALYVEPPASFDKPKSYSQKMSLNSVVSPDPNYQTRATATSNANLRDFQASSQDTIRQTKNNLDLLRQIQAMHDEAARYSSAPPSHGSDSRKTSVASSSSSRSGSQTLNPSYFTQPQFTATEVAPPQSPPKQNLYVMDNHGDLHRMSQDGNIPILSECRNETTEGVKPSFCFSSPRSSCPVIDHTRDSMPISPQSSYSHSFGPGNTQSFGSTIGQSFEYGNGQTFGAANSSMSFSMSPQTRPTALSLESFRYSQSFSQPFADYSGDRDTAVSYDRDSSFSYADRDTRTSMGSETGLYL
ncbi:hypothetical protein AC1031_007087 [Aphanomyces cochlioides]|nr:hypothetical protein AC1031_007087 [Aphanomyces cochlioides]